ncbi:keratin, type I cytoskeletal 9-like isoform X1 [Daphnia pulex]|uniref:keratin, type I cytoskeletal 9-like isoform X1 n=1 Tax=Daphnia pulex TaxID=6669 RepID=UPI001EDCBEE3|nr:keratin, type I cytoskeletal 9-like isoform X1 [Daphnia pulex]
MVIEKRDGYRRRQGLVLGFLVFYFVALQCENANAFRLSRNPLFNGMLNRRNAIPATNIANLHHNQLFKNNFNQHQFYTQQQQQQEPAVAASSTSVVTTNSLNTNHVDPYVSGSNPVDKEVAENPDLDQIAADAQVEQKSANLVAAASSTSYSSTVGGAGAYGAGSGSSSLGSYGGISAGSGYGGISAGSGYGGISAGSGYGGGSIGSYGDTGGASYGSSGSYGGSSIGSGSSYGGFSGGSSYGSGLGGSSYGIGGSTGLSGSHSSYGGGGGGYGTSAPSYSITYPAQQGATKADTIHLLSSLAPSLLLSSLLLPLALALLTNTTSSLYGRKRRDLSDDYDDDLQFSLNGDILDGDITLLDTHFFPTMDAMLESYSPDDTERLAEFVRHRGLLNINNPCLEKLACLATATKSKFKRYDSLKKAITLLEKSTDPDIKKRLKKGSSVGAKKERNCLTKFICKSMKSAVSP